MSVIRTVNWKYIAENPDFLSILFRDCNSGYQLRNRRKYVMDDYHDLESIRYIEVWITRFDSNRYVFLSDLQRMTVIQIYRLLYEIKFFRLFVKDLPNLFTDWQLLHPKTLDYITKDNIISGRTRTHSKYIPINILSLDGNVHLLDTETKKVKEFTCPISYPELKNEIGNELDIGNYIVDIDEKNKRVKSFTMTLERVGNRIKNVTVTFDEKNNWKCSINDNEPLYQPVRTVCTENFTISLVDLEKKRILRVTGDTFKYKNRLKSLLDHSAIELHIYKFKTFTALSCICKDYIVIRDLSHIKKNM